MGKPKVLYINGQRIVLSDKGSDSIDVGYIPLPWQSGATYKPFAHVSFGNFEYVNVSGKAIKSNDILSEYRQGGIWSKVAFQGTENGQANISQQYDITLQYVENKTYGIVLDQKFRAVIGEMSYKTASGSCDIDLNINGSGVTGLTGLSASNSKATANATGNNTVELHDSINLVVSNVSVVEDLQLSIQVIPE